LLLSVVDVTHCMLSTGRGPSGCLKLTAEEDSTDVLLKRFWELEEVPYSSPNYAVETFNDTTTRDSEERYIVRLPCSGLNNR